MFQSTIFHISLLITYSSKLPVDSKMDINLTILKGWSLATMVSRLSCLTNPCATSNFFSVMYFFKVHLCHWQSGISDQFEESPSAGGRIFSASGSCCSWFYLKLHHGKCTRISPNCNCKTLNQSPSKPPRTNRRNITITFSTQTSN